MGCKGNMSLLIIRIKSVIDFLEYDPGVMALGIGSLRTTVHYLFCTFSDNGLAPYAFK